MMRLIDADALYTELVKMKDFGELTAKKAIREVEKAPTIDAEPHWIPCSERMPEDGRYLCDYGDCIDFGRVINGEWYVNGVIAWMPLPKPYRGGTRCQ